MIGGAISSQSQSHMISVILLSLLMRCFPAERDKLSQNCGGL